MSNLKDAIQFDFTQDKVSDTGIIDGLGMALMRMAAKATRPDYTGLSIANKMIRKVLPSQRYVRAQLFTDTFFEFPYGDGYWGCLLDNSKVYCPDIEQILYSLRDIDYNFIDCGANYGYMSCILSSEEYGKKPCIAIEADPDTYSYLLRNHKLNGERFEITNRAVFSKSGEMVNIHGEKHEARSILDENGSRHDGNVETIALDDLKDWRATHKGKPTILKLDVEGVEIDAMKGALELSEENLLVVYEDHGSDRTHEVSDYFMNSLGYSVFNGRTGHFHQVKKLDEITKIKTNHRCGYDFFGTKSEFWLEALSKQVS